MWWEVVAGVAALFAALFAAGRLMRGVFRMASSVKRIADWFPDDRNGTRSLPNLVHQTRQLTAQNQAKINHVHDCLHTRIKELHRRLDSLNDRLGAHAVEDRDEKQTILVEIADVKARILELENRF